MKEISKKILLKNSKFIQVTPAKLYDLKVMIFRTIFFPFLGTFHEVKGIISFPLQLIIFFFKKKEELTSKNEITHNISEVNQDFRDISDCRFGKVEPKMRRGC